MANPAVWVVAIEGHGGIKDVAIACKAGGVALGIQDSSNSAGDNNALTFVNVWLYGGGSSQDCNPLRIWGPTLTGSGNGTSQKDPEFEVFSRIIVSPDGRFAAFVTFRLGDPKEKLVMLFLDSSQPPRFLEFERPRAESPGSFGDGPVSFTRDGKGVVYPVGDGDVDNLWLQYLDGSPGKQVTDFKSELIRDFDWSFDGKQLAVIRGHRESDVVLIRNSEK
jgi:hypothetical protein